jgi:hypothetical protein
VGFGDSGLRGRLRVSTVRGSSPTTSFFWFFSQTAHQDRISQRLGQSRRRRGRCQVSRSLASAAGSQRRAAGLGGVIKYEQTFQGIEKWSQGVCLMFAFGRQRRSALVKLGPVIHSWPPNCLFQRLNLTEPLLARFCNL